MSYLVSICIPAYKQPSLLERCLQSIVEQTYDQIDVVISDDTPDNSVKIIVDKFVKRLKISYHKNENALGTPSNWNAALSKAKGDLVLLLHHDDFLASRESIHKFADAFTDDPSIDFVFGRNPSIELLSKSKRFDGAFFFQYYRQPELLLAGNFLGAPSNVMLRSKAIEQYDIRYKWIVDIEYYVRLFKKRMNFFYVDEKLVEIGIHEGQVSNECVSNDAVLLSENISYAALNKLKIKSIRLFDFYWRLIRNSNVREIGELIKIVGSPSHIPPFIKRIIALQKDIPQLILRMALISKILMLMAYIRVKE